MRTVRRPPRPATRSVLLGLAIGLGALVVATCQPASSVPTSGGRLPVVTTITVLGDLIRNVGGDLIEVTSLVPPGTDVHTFEPSPGDVRAVTNGRLLVMNGLGLDAWLEATISNAAVEGTPLVKLAEGLPGVELLPGEEPGTQNPHLWMSVPYAMLYVERISSALQSADPANAAKYEHQATAYRQRLEALDASARTRIGTIPAADRKLVTFHDAFPYFAREYGLEVVGVAVEAPGQDPSAGEIAALVAAIKAAGVKAIFSEDQFPTRLVDQIAAETGAQVIADLYDDALGDPPVTSYEALIQWDVDKLVEALR
jgi:manganese/iron transport system substrate-binding protein